MGKFNKSHQGSNSYGGSSRSRGFNRRDNNDRQMYDAVCENCGKACQIPFKPTSGRPVFCNNCFKKDGDRGNSNYGNRSFPRRDMDRRNDSPREFREAKPEKPIQTLSQEQFETLNTKLNQILRYLQTPENKEALQMDLSELKQEEEVSEKKKTTKKTAKKKVTKSKK